MSRRNTHREVEAPQGHLATDIALGIDNGQKAFVSACHWSPQSSIYLPRFIDGFDRSKVPLLDCGISEGLNDRGCIAHPPRSKLVIHRRAQRRLFHGAKPTGGNHRGDESRHVSNISREGPRRPEV